MKSKMLRILVGAALLVLAAIVFRQWRANTRLITESQRPTTAVSQDSPAAPLRSPPPQSAQRVTIARALVQPAPTTPQKLFVQWKGQWYPAEILASSGRSNFIHYTGFDAQWDEWVTSERMRYSSDYSIPGTAIPTENTAEQTPAVRSTPMPGDFVVRWGERWWRAEVLQANGDQFLIRYVGYGAEWDEWVGPDRFKKYAEEDAQNDRKDKLTESLAEATTLAEPTPNPAPKIQGAPAVGDLLVQWGQQWWPAEVVRQDGDRCLIHYKGYSDQWDEWVTPERLSVFSGK
jgi:hypothetical protein